MQMKEISKVDVFQHGSNEWMDGWMSGFLKAAYG